MGKEKLGFYCSSISWGGLEMNFVKCAIWLSNRNYHVKVYCVKDSPIDNKLQSTNLSPTHVHRNKKYFDLLNAFRVYRLMKKDNIKGVWLRDTRDLSTIGLTKNFSRNKIKIIYQQAMQISHPKKDIFHSIRFAKIDAWITLLNNLSDQVKKFTKIKPEKVHVIPLAVDLKRAPENQSKDFSRTYFKIAPEKYVIGILGRICHHKGQLFLVEQLEKLRAKNLDIELLIVGEGTRNENDGYEDLLLKTIKDLNLTKQVHIHPFMADPEIFYSSIDLFVMASLGETFGTVTLEAMSCGVPVLGTNAAGTPEILNFGELGYLFEVSDSEDFCKQAESIFNQPDEVQQKVQLARKIATDKYSQKAVTDEIENVLLELNLSNCKVD
jgi:glycosyltransferase involved in cell wall biosynthesis